MYTSINYMYYYYCMYNYCMYLIKCTYLFKYTSSQVLVKLNSFGFCLKPQLSHTPVFSSRVFMYKESRVI